MLSNLKWSDTDNFYMNLGCHKVSPSNVLNLQSEWYNKESFLYIYVIFVFLVSLLYRHFPGCGVGGVRGRQGLPLAVQHAHHDPGV